MVLPHPLFPTIKKSSPLPIFLPVTRNVFNGFLPSKLAPQQLVLELSSLIDCFL
jgi:hypothetical protein